MFDPLTRPAVVDDVDDLVWLEALARDQIVAQRGGDLWLARHPKQSPGWPSVAEGDVMVGTIDGVVVAYLRFDVSDAVVYVRDVFVHPDAREVGFGDTLLAATVEVGRAAGARRIEGEALPGDRDTKNLYERAGITAKRITVSSAIDGIVSPSD